MNLTTTNIGLEDDQARIKKVKLNHFTVRGGPTYINWLQLNTRTISIATTFSSLSLSLSLSLSFLFFMEGLSPYISPFRPSSYYTC